MPKQFFTTFSIFVSALSLFFIRLLSVRDSDRRLTNLARAMERPVDDLTPSLTALGPSDDIHQILNAQLDVLAISSQAKQAIVSVLLGIARATEVQSRSTLGIQSQTQTVPDFAEVTAEAAPTGSTGTYRLHQRSFNSHSGSGYTVWYIGQSNQSISSPPMIPQAKTADLYVNYDLSTKTHQYWMLGTNNQWETVSRGVEYPLNHDRVLTIRANGEPSWVTQASTTTIQTRKEWDIREKSAHP
ncbi:hypothetical protein EI94DRAFT_1700271 [Lactarius quietus]|nr:hypothetical protein EI94DRAFT_1700271 [Lactarius quietus]